MDLKSLSQRRLDNLDTAVGYFQKRLNKARKSRDKLGVTLPGLSSDPVLYDVLSAEIMVLDDVIQYLKLC